MNNEKGLAQAVQDGDWNTARHLAAIRVAQMMERTESPRETKALAISLQSLIDECEENDVANSLEDTPLGRILAEANAVMSKKPQPRYVRDGIEQERTIMPL